MPFTVRAGEQRLDRGLPGRQRVLRLERVQTIEHLALQAQPCGAREVAIHDRLPDAHRQRVSGLTVPRNQARAQGAVAVQDRAAEQQLERHVAIVEGVKVFRRRAGLEVVRADDRHIDDGATSERRHEDDGLRPQQAARRLVPLLGRAEQLHHPRPRVGRIRPSRHRDADLRVEQDRANRQVAGVLDAQPQYQRRPRGVGERLGIIDGEAQLRSLRLHRRRGRIRRLCAVRHLTRETGSACRDRSDCADPD
jgi:hypothetical protein